VRKPAEGRSVLFAVLLLSAWLLIVGIYSFRKPAYNFDIIPYMGVVLMYDGTAEEELLKEVYKRAKSEIPPEKFKLIDDPANSYRLAMLHDLKFYKENLGMYVIKPLYISCAYLFYKCGMPLTKATVLPSVIGYVLICMLVFAWLTKYTGYKLALLFSFLISLFSPLISAGQLSTPDALCSLFLLSGIYFLTERQSASASIVFLALSVLTRLDALLPAIFLVYLPLTGRFLPRIQIWKILLQGCVLLCCYFIAVLPAKQMGWNQFYYFSFIARMNLDYTPSTSFDPGAYFELIKSQFMTGLYFSHLLVYFLLSALIVFKPGTLPGKRKLDEVQVLLAGLAITLILRFILHPAGADRFYIAYYICAIVFGVREFFKEKVPQVTENKG
jgi:hypothetical protein